MNYILNQYLRFGINPTQLIKSKNEYSVRFDNHDWWKVLLANENCGRGHRANISYIQRGIDEDIVSRIIIPVTTAPPYNGIMYFGQDIK